MATYRLTLEYDGSAFSGWQRQRDRRTVEGVLREAIRRVCGADPLSLNAAGRTDAGAHAHGQVVSMEISSPLTPEQWRLALNAALPADVVVLDARTAAPGFHARRDALARTYRYVVAARTTRMAVGRQYAWRVRGPLDVESMRRAARLLAGRHDFAAFGSSPRPGGTTIRTVHAVKVRRVGEVVVIDVDADAFLYGMMRSFAGALVAVGEGRMSEHELHRLLLEPPARRANLTVAPAHGLHQWHVIYPETR
jgi:tRNA pseudouridine38-40 synthase